MKRRDEVSVGILIAVSTIVLILGTLWLVRGSMKSGYPLYTRFAWGQNLKQGQPVLLAGVSVGYVGDVNLRRDGFLDVLLRINDKYTIPKGSTAAVKAVGIFGDVAVSLTPPIPVPAASYAEGDTVPAGAGAADIDKIMSNVDSITRSANAMLKSINQQVIEAGRADREPTSLDAPVGEDGDTALGALIKSDAPDTEDEVAETLRHETVQKAIEDLPDNEKTVIHLRFGTGGEPPQTLTQIGRRLGVSSSRAREIEEQALRRLSREATLSALREAA